MIKRVVALCLCACMFPINMPGSYAASEGSDKVVITEESAKLYKGSYDILYDRITDRGYAITSLTGTYFGMFTRDSAIQAMAHTAYGDYEAARSILRYMLSYHVELGLQRGTHIIEELKEEEYRNNYLSSKKDTLANYYDEQTEPGAGHFLINAPNNATATPFTTGERSIASVQAYLEIQSSATVVAQIYTDLMDPSTLVGQGSCRFEGSSKGWKTVSLDKEISVTPGKTYYLKLYAIEGSGRTVLYGVTSAKSTAKKCWNYDKNAYGGNGWQELGVYVAFIIGESGSEVTVDYKVSQRKADMALYLINEPNNGAAQPFVPKNNKIYSVDVHLDRSSGTDTVKAMICTDYNDLSTAIATATYTFGDTPNGWQNITFDSPVNVTPGKTYYLVVRGSADSGRVVWNGTTQNCDCPKSLNYDKNTFGGWTQSGNYLGFEIISYPTKTVAQSFEARGNTMGGVDLTVYSEKAGGKVTVEIRTDYADANSIIAKAQTSIDKAGENTYTLSFSKEVPMQYQDTYYLVVTFEGTDGYVRLMTDTGAAADSYAQGDDWARVGYAFLAHALFGVDREPIITLDGKTAGVQEIPCAGELITAVKVVLAKDKNAAGTLKATLYKGNSQKAQLINTKKIAIETLSEEADWLMIKFDLPLIKTQKNGNYYIKLETEDAKGNVYWCGSTTIDNHGTYLEKDAAYTVVKGEAGFEALKGVTRLLSNYTQTDATYMLIHAWVMYANNCKGTEEDKEFIEQSYPIIRDFANYFLSDEYYNKEMDLIYNPSLEHSKKGRYWQAYDLITNVFASQAFHELSSLAKDMGDSRNAGIWNAYAEKIKIGIHKHLTCEIDGKTIYAEFYDREDNMKFYEGISWVNFAPVAAEWFGMDMEIMKNTYEIYKKHAGISMFGYNGLATDHFLGTTETRREFIGKGVAWELMFCNMIGDTERIAEIVQLELATAKRYNLSVYPESWTSETTVSDPGNQEHCSWQVYAMSVVFPQLTLEAEGEDEGDGSAPGGNDSLGGNEDSTVNEGNSEKDTQTSDKGISFALIASIAAVLTAAVASISFFLFKKKKA